MSSAKATTLVSLILFQGESTVSSMLFRTPVQTVNFETSLRASALNQKSAILAQGSIFLLELVSFATLPVLLAVRALRERTVYLAAAESSTSSFLSLLTPPIWPFS